MRPLLLLCAMSCVLCSVASAQWVEATIELPLSIPISMVCNPAGTRLYVTDVNSDSSFVNVIDATNNAWLRKIPVGTSPGRLCYNTAGDKLYVSIPAGTITVIDATADTVIKDIAIGRYPGLPTYYAAGNRIYCTSYDDQTIAAIDGATDSVLHRIQLPTAAGYLVLNDAEQKLYVLAGSGLEVVDCTADTIAAHIDLPGDGEVCLSTGQNKLYCTMHLDSQAVVVDCSADTVLSKTVRVGLWPNTVGYSPSADKVYVGAYAGQNVTVIDCASDSALAAIPFPGIPWGICADPATGNVYCTSRGTNQAFILDGSGDSVLAAVTVGELPGTAYWGAARHRAYIANEGSHSISVLRDSPGGVEESMNDGRGTIDVSATIVRGVLVLPGLGTRSGLSNNPVMSRAALLDISGRKVLDLCAGANDVSRLVPGVYFVRDSEHAARRVILAR
jgi:YVTN family beta-propeller protein